MDQTFGSQLAGPVTVRGARAPTAWLGGFAVAGEAEPGGWVFRFPDGGGELHAAELAGERPGALWVQPPVPSGSRYASPVALDAVAPETWRGAVAPLARRLFMQLYVRREPDGAVRAFLRDPSYNLGLRFGEMTVRLQGRHIDFQSEHGGFGAELDESGNGFALDFAGLGLPPFQFKRDGAPDAPEPAAYREPFATGDGWRIGNAAVAGIAPDALARLTAEIEAEAVDGPAAPAVHALAIARHGTLVFDRYFAGFDEALPHDTRSAGKTYADVLAGAAQLAGAPVDDASPLLALFPQYGRIANDDAHKRAITVGNALSMSTGLDCDDNDAKSIGNEDREQSQTEQPDWYKLVLDAPMLRTPGTRSVYCSASINLAGGAVAAATHAWLPMYFEQHVAEPLQMQAYALNLMPSGQWYLGGGAYVRPRDFLKIGQVFLDGGLWNRSPIVPRAWVERSWQKHGNLGPGDDYGYAWHLRTYAVGARAVRVYEAQGNGGQILDVVPERDLTVMLAQGNYNNFKTWGATRDRIMLAILAATTSE
jgi:CubicO group peptidase (beta-lactamase class C family)